MFRTLLTLLAASTATISATSASVTPHDQYSSSVGVLGCKINTNRVAYWPSAVSCQNICVNVTYQDRSLTLLKIDQSGGAYDISYDAWNYLVFGSSATTEPHAGGGIPMEYEVVDPSQCADIMNAGKLPLSAANSMNYVSSCIAVSDSFVGTNYELWNIQDPVCKYGVDELCTLPPLGVSNQATCPSGLGSTAALPESIRVVNILYPSGEEEIAP